MNIDLNLEQLTELNQIRGLLQSPDFESQVLGFEMFKNSSLFRHRMYDLSYETRNKKIIPLNWFIRKSEEIIARRINSNQDSNLIMTDERFSDLILPIIDSILLCEPKFTSVITFNTDKHTIMKNYDPESVLNRYISQS